MACSLMISREKESKAWRWFMAPLEKCLYATGGIEWTSKVNDSKPKDDNLTINFLLIPPKILHSKTAINNEKIHPLNFITFPCSLFYPFSAKIIFILPTFVSLETLSKTELKSWWLGYIYLHNCHILSLLKILLSIANWECFCFLLLRAWSQFFSLRKLLP